MKTEKFEYNGYQATVIIPDNPNGRWVWKTEFFYAFDQAERALLNDGFTRVYYQISNKYGGPDAVRLMHLFHLHLIESYPFLRKKALLFGFSRGGLYAFNYALYYPEYVEKVYLDAPVLDMKSWPEKDSPEQAQMFGEYCLNEETLLRFCGNPVDKMAEYFDLKIPTLIVAGDADEVVPLNENAGRMIEFCEQNKIPLIYTVKPGCKHHPHSLEDVSFIVDFIERED